MTVFGRLFFYTDLTGKCALQSGGGDHIDAHNGRISIFSKISSIISTQKAIWKFNTTAKL